MTKVQRLSKSEKLKLRRFLQSIALSAVSAQNRLDGDKSESYITDLLADVRSDLEVAESIVEKMNEYAEEDV